MDKSKQSSRLTLESGIEPIMSPAMGPAGEQSRLSDARRARETARHPQQRQPQQRLADRLADIDRSLGHSTAPEPTSKHRAATQPEHDNVRFAREAIARMAANEAAGSAADDCMACAMLDARAGDACRPAATAIPASSSKPQTAKPQISKLAGPKAGPKAMTTRPTKTPAATPATKPVRRNAVAPAAPVARRRPRPAKAFGAGFAGGAVIAMVGGLFGTAMFLEPQDVTAAPHHLIPSSIDFTFSLASISDVHDGGPAWAWREAVTLRTIRDLSVQRADTGSSWATRAQLASLSRAGAAYPVMLPTVAARQPVALNQRQPHHTVSVEVMGKLETAALPASTGTPLVLAVATAGPAIETRSSTRRADEKSPEPTASAAAPAATPVIAPAAANAGKTALASGRAAKTVHHATPRPERDAAMNSTAKTATAPPPGPAQAHTAHHVLTKASPEPQRPLKLIATQKRPLNRDDDEDNDTASISAPLPKLGNARAQEARSGGNAGTPKKAMLLGAGSTVTAPDKPQQAAEAPKTKWWKAPMPGWAPFRSSNNN